MTDQMSNDLVSVVIPIYNSEKFLKESLESVINQTYKNIEIICIDDGSTDNSLEILNQFTNKIIIISQKNNGLASALNIGIDNMHGKWFKWFSPDDLMYPDAIESLVNAAKQLHENTIVYSNWTIIDESRKKIREFYESDYNDLNNFEYGVRLLDSQQINVNTSLIPKTLIDTLDGFRNVSNPVVIDYDFFLRASIIYNVKFFLVNLPLIKYRVHKKQLSHKNIIKSLVSLEDVKKNILENTSSINLKKYISELNIYRKNKPVIQKFLVLNLKLASFLPALISDRILTFYLKNIRTNR
jgi:hypothetical protein